MSEGGARAAVHVGSELPVEATIACTVTAIKGGGGGRAIVTIATDQPLGLESVDGQHTFEVSADRLVGRARGQHSLRFG